MISLVKKIALLETRNVNTHNSGSSTANWGKNLVAKRREMGMEYSQK
jgi:hypothetical protein